MNVRVHELELWPYRDNSAEPLKCQDVISVSFAPGWIIVTFLNRSQAGFSNRLYDRYFLHSSVDKELPAVVPESKS